MEKNICYTKTVVFTLLFMIYSCDKKEEQPIITVEEKRSLAEIENLYYKIKPLQDSIERISVFRKNEETLYGVSFSEDSLHYNFFLMLRDKYAVGGGYKILRKNNMYIILGGGRKPKDTLIIDTLTQYFQRKGKITFDRSIDERYEEFPYLVFLIKKDDLSNIDVGGFP